MTLEALDSVLAGAPRREVLVVSDRYPPDAGGGAERSLHLMLREPILRDRVLVVAFDKTLAAPVRRTVDGVETIALPAPAAFPLDRLTQAEVDRLKRRRFGLKWPAFAWAALRGPHKRERLTALALHVLSRPEGGVATDHVTVPGGAMETAVRRILDHVHPALAHADNARAIMVAAGALEGGDIPLVAVVRDHRFTRARFDQGEDRPARRPLERAAARFAARALAFRQARLRKAETALVASRRLAADLSGVLPSQRLRQLRLTPVMQPESLQAAAAHAPANGFNVLVVGSLTPNKGQERFVNLWPAVLRDLPHATLDIAGGGPSFAAIARRIADLRISDSVRLHGQLEWPALSELYAQCHVVALPTLWSEPFGRAPLEAGAAGRAVVAYAVGGHVETVADGVTGRLVAPGDEPGFVAALVELGRDSAARDELGDSNRLQAAAFAPALLAQGLLSAWETARGDIPGGRTGDGP